MLCVCMCVCTFIYVGGSLGKCVARGKSARSLFDFLQVFYIYLLIPTFHIKGFPP